MRGAQCSGERESRDISTALTVGQSSSRNRTNEGEHCGPCCHTQKECPYWHRAETEGPINGCAPRGKPEDEKVPPIRSSRWAGSGRVGDRARGCRIGGTTPTFPLLDRRPSDAWRNT